MHINCCLFLVVIFENIIYPLKFQIAQAEAALQQMEAKFKNETGIAKAQRDFDIKKGIKFIFS